MFFSIGFTEDRKAERFTVLEVTITRALQLIQGAQLLWLKKPDVDSYCSVTIWSVIDRVQYGLHSGWTETSESTVGKNDVRAQNQRAIHCLRSPSQLFTTSEFSTALLMQS